MKIDFKKVICLTVLILTAQLSLTPSARAEFKTYEVISTQADNYAKRIVKMAVEGIGTRPNYFNSVISAELENGLYMIEKQSRGNQDLREHS